MCHFKQFYLFILYIMSHISYMSYIFEYKKPDGDNIYCIFIGDETHTKIIRQILDEDVNNEYKSNDSYIYTKFMSKIAEFSSEELEKQKGPGIHEIHEIPEIPEMHEIPKSSEEQLHEDIDSDFYDSGDESEGADEGGSKNELHGGVKTDEESDASETLSPDTLSPRSSLHAQEMQEMKEIPDDSDIELFNAYIRYDYIRNIDKNKIQFSHMKIYETDTMALVKMKIEHVLQIPRIYLYIYYDEAILNNLVVIDKGSGICDECVTTDPSRVYIDHYFIKKNPPIKKKRGVHRKPPHNILINYNIDPLEYIVKNNEEFYSMLHNRPGDDFIYTSCDTCILYELNIPSKKINVVSYIDTYEYVFRKHISDINKIIIIHQYFKKYWFDVVNEGNEYFTLEKKFQLEENKLNENNILDNYVNEYLSNVIDESGENTIVINDYIITEAIVHVNYKTRFQEEQDDFIELYKIFDRFKLNNDIPFIKMKAEKNSVIYKIHDDIIKNRNNDMPQKIV